MAAIPITRSGSTSASSFRPDQVPKSIPRDYTPPSPLKEGSKPSRSKTTKSVHSERIFALQDAPTLYPSDEQFSDPLGYISSISQEYNKYGIIKIIPPSTWKPNFAIDTSRFKFQTRKQTISSMNIHSRPTLNYNQALTKFHFNQGTIMKPPTLERRPVNLLQVKKTVQKYGGPDQVTEDKKWGDVGRECGFTTTGSVSSSMKSIYTKWIQPFEEYMEKAKFQPATRDGTPTSANDPSFPIDTSTDASAECSSNSALNSTRFSKSVRMVAFNPYKRVSSSNSHSSCAKCRRTGSTLNPLATCVDCGEAFHLHCVNPPLQSVPIGWYCPTCIKTAGNDFGFEDGGEYTLSSFQKVAEEFKERWFQRGSSYSTKSKYPVDEDECEREFWKLVESTFEQVTVEYGADLHSIKLGSGFPTAEKHPNDPYSRCGWNLNNLPVLPQSLFCNIRNDISGMMIPWIYIGMVFSTFCWHAEDHNTYSINFHHFGETKTWYGIPEHGADQFEQVMKATAPELFEANPDLLFHITTLLSPGKLIEKGIPVYAADQRPGEFIITFPRAYHAGFNHGFNCAEAVNFALPDWLPYGFLCVKTYQQHQKHPVFSHEELVVSSALKTPLPDAAKWVRDALHDIIYRETDDRERVFAFIPKISVVEHDDAELISSYTQEQCRVCHAFCFLSHVSCACTKQIPVCLLHTTEVCLLCSPERMKLHFRCSLEYLKSLAQQMDNIVSRSVQWKNRLKQLCLEHARPPLKDLQRLLSEGDSIPGIESELHDLRSFIDKGTGWVEKVTAFLQIRKRKPANRRGALQDNSQQEVSSKNNSDQMRSLHYIKGLIEEAEQLNFDCPEIQQLIGLHEQILQTQVQIRSVLDSGDRAVDMDQLKFLLDQASLFMVDMPEIKELETFISQTEWYEHALYFATHKDVSLEELVTFVADGTAIGISYADVPLESQDEHILKKLEKRIEEGRTWGTKAGEFLKHSKVSLEELEAIASNGLKLAVAKSLLHDVNHRYNQVRHWVKRAQPWLDFIRGSEDFASSQVSVSSSSQKRRLPGTLENMNQIIKDATQLPVDIQYLSDLPVLKEGYESCMTWLKSCQALLVAPGSKTSGPSNLEGWLFSQLRRVLSLVSPTVSHFSPESNQDTQDSQVQLYCVCRTTDDGGLMVGCDLCGVWYHAACLKLTKKDLKTEDGSYLCPVCDISCTYPYNGASLRTQYGILPLKGLAKTSIEKWKETHEQLGAVCSTNGLLAALEATHTFKAIMRHLESLDAQVSSNTACIVSNSDTYQEDQEVPVNVIEEWRSVLRILFGLPVIFTSATNVLTSLLEKHAPLSRFPIEIAPPSLTTTTKGKKSKKRRASSYEDMDVDIPLYCLCQKPYAEESPMIGCDNCDDWYHFECVGIDPAAASQIQNYVCPKCDPDESIIEKKDVSVEESEDQSPAPVAEQDKNPSTDLMSLETAGEFVVPTDEKGPQRQDPIPTSVSEPKKKVTKPREPKSTSTPKKPKTPTKKNSSTPKPKKPRTKKSMGDAQPPPTPSAPTPVVDDSTVSSTSNPSTSSATSTSNSMSKAALEKLPPKKRKSFKEPLPPTDIKSTATSSTPISHLAKRLKSDSTTKRAILPKLPSSSTTSHAPSSFMNMVTSLSALPPPPVSVSMLPPAPPSSATPASSASQIPMLDENVASWLCQMTSNALSEIYGQDTKS